MNQLSHKYQRLRHLFLCHMPPDLLEVFGKECWRWGKTDLPMGRDLMLVYKYDDRFDYADFAYVWNKLFEIVIGDDSKTAMRPIERISDVKVIKNEEEDFVKAYVATTGREEEGMAMAYHDVLYNYLKSSSKFSLKLKYNKAKEAVEFKTLVTIGVNGQNFSFEIPLFSLNPNDLIGDQAIESYVREVINSENTPENREKYRSAICKNLITYIENSGDSDAGKTYFEKLLTEYAESLVSLMKGEPSEDPFNGLAKQSIFIDCLAFGPSGNTRESLGSRFKNNWVEIDVSKLFSQNKDNGSLHLDGTKVVKELINQRQTLLFIGDNLQQSIHASDLTWEDLEKAERGNTEDLNSRIENNATLKEKIGVLRDINDHLNQLIEEEGLDSEGLEITTNTGENNFSWGILLANYIRFVANDYFHRPTLHILETNRRRDNNATIPDGYAKPEMHGKNEREDFVFFFTISEKKGIGSFIWTDEILTKVNGYFSRSQRYWQFKNINKANVSKAYEIFSKLASHIQEQQFNVKFSEFFIYRYILEKNPNVFPNEPA